MFVRLLIGYSALIVNTNILCSKAYLIGEPCRYDEDCFVEHSYCEMQQICECKENFVETEDRETCIALVGAYCHSKHDCSSLPNSKCNDERCECDTGFIPHPQGSKCMPVATHLEGYCQEDLQCFPHFGQNSFCNKPTGQCNCRQNYHFDNGNGYCLLNKGLGQTCGNSSECYIGEAFKGTVVCNTGSCTCKDGYYETEYRICASGSSNCSASFGILLLLLILFIYY